MVSKVPFVLEGEGGNPSSFTRPHTNFPHPITPTYGRHQVGGEDCQHLPHWQG